MLRTFVLVGLLMAAFHTAVSAQTVPPVAMPGLPAEQARKLAELQAAQSAARRPGDEKLSCDAIRKEVTAILQDPEFQAYQASVVSAAQGARNPQGVSEKLAALMPKLARSQYLMYLAVGRNCSWADSDLAAIANPARP